MSRAKKRTQSVKGSHQVQRTAKASRQAQDEHEVAELVADLSCGFSAASEFAAECRLRRDNASIERELVLAAEQLWRRAAREGHPLTAAISELRAELERHSAVLFTLQERLAAHMAVAPHDHISPDPDDVHRVRLAVLGPDRATHPTAQPPA